MEENARVTFEAVFLSKNPPDDERVGRLLYWARRLDELGLAPKSAGNLSFRTKRGFVITGSGINLGAIGEEELAEVLKVKIEKNWTVVQAKGKVVPSKESLLHSEIYHLRAEINAVFHAHDQVVLKSADKLMLPCTEREQPRGSCELVREVSRLLGLLGDVRYFVLRNHGVISMGETLEEAGRLAEDMNKMARKQEGCVTDK